MRLVISVKFLIMNHHKFVTIKFTKKTTKNSMCVICVKIIDLIEKVSPGKESNFIQVGKKFGFFPLIIFKKCDVI